MDIKQDEFKPASEKDSSVNLKLGAGDKPRTVALKWIFAVAAVVVVGIILWLWLSDSDTRSVHYKTAEVVQGNLTVKVTATGTLEPVNQVDVGSEVSGTIREVRVDFNTRVTQGQVLAVLDTKQLQARVNQARASLQLAKARVEEATATVEETREKNKRMQALASKGLCAQEDCDAALATYNRAKASLASTKAQVVQAKAALDAEMTTLQKATIYSPINGIVLKRNVEPGQTVAASLQTPVLFTLAENLTQMELQVDVDEADVGQVSEGQKAVFSVDAYPDKNFPAEITEVHLAPQTVEGVVTYEAVLRVDNSELLLRPGMTATADIEVKTLENVLLVPNQALRFVPPVARQRTTSSGGSLFSKLMPRPPRAQKQAKEASVDVKRQRVWTLRNGDLVAVTISVGATDGSFTQVTAGDVKPDMLVVTDAISNSR
ncbi:efflux RND transporter periplasmic adaptor subunit [Kaarinaea lacus]